VSCLITHDTPTRSLTSRLRLCLSRVLCGAPAASRHGERHSGATKEQWLIGLRAYGHDRRREDVQGCCKGVLQCVAVCCTDDEKMCKAAAKVCCSVLQCVAPTTRRCARLLQRSPCLTLFTSSLHTHTHTHVFAYIHTHTPIHTHTHTHTPLSLSFFLSVSLSRFFSCSC